MATPSSSIAAMAGRAHPRAVLYRMVTDTHTCPYGLKSKDLLERRGFDVEDRPLGTREETDAFKREHGVETTPQAFIDGERVGGYEALRERLDESVEAEGATSYRPVVAIFAVALAMALAASWATLGTLLSVRVVEWFVAFSVCILAIQKLQDLESFSTMFLNYDLLAQRVVRYGYVYPFLEAAGGVLMIAGVLTWLAAPVMLLIGGIGAVSVFKAVYVDKREIKCACVSGNSRVPLGFVSLSENLAMIAMGIWMLLK